MTTTTTTTTTTRLMLMLLTTNLAISFLQQQDHDLDHDDQQQQPQQQQQQSQDDSLNSKIDSSTTPWTFFFLLTMMIIIIIIVFSLMCKRRLNSRNNTSVKARFRGRGAHVVAVVSVASALVLSLVLLLTTRLILVSMRMIPPIHVHVHDPHHHHHHHNNQAAMNTFAGNITSAHDNPQSLFNSNVNNNNTNTNNTNHALMIPQSPRINSTDDTAKRTTATFHHDYESLLSLSSSKPFNTSSIRIAYVIAITTCPKVGSDDDRTTRTSRNAVLMDGPAVLAHSIRKSSSTTKYPNYDLIAMVLPQVMTGRDDDHDHDETLNHTNNHDNTTTTATATNNDNQHHHHEYSTTNTTTTNTGGGCVDHLPRLGYKVVVQSLPFAISELFNHFKYQNSIRKHGCCGEMEFLKLQAFALTDYHVVVQLDTDVLILQPLDDIVDAMMGYTTTGTTTTTTSNTSTPSEATTGTTTSAGIQIMRRNKKWIPTRPTTSNHASITNSSTTTTTTTTTITTDDMAMTTSGIDFMFTRDYIQMSKMTTDRNKFAIQGGFFVLKPNMTVYHDMIRVVKEGYFTRSRGWGKLHYGGYYGSSQIQGFLSYYYGEYIYKLNEKSVIVELNPCIYNAMVSFPPYEPDGKTCRYYNTDEHNNNNGHGHVDENRQSTYKDYNMTPSNTTTTTTTTNTTTTSSCQDCARLSLSELHSTHYTVCYKPWKCPRHKYFGQLCKDTHRIWFETRRDLELSWGQIVPNGTVGYNLNVTLGYCTQGHEWGYIPMTLP